MKKPIKKKLSQKKFFNSPKKSFSRKEKHVFLNLLAELLDNGFTLERSLNFMATVLPKKKQEIKNMERALLKGKRLNKCLKELKLTPSQQAQLSFSEVHGDLVGTLNRLSKHLEDQEKQRQHLQKVVSYPVLLLLFLFGMVLGMKWYILPQLGDLYESDNGVNIGLILINQSPKIILVSLVLMGMGYLILKSYLGKKTEIGKANWLCQLPVVKTFLIHYYTSLFATEWGKLLTQGMEFREVVLVMNKKGYTPLMREMAVAIEKQIEKGQPINQTIMKWQFLRPELNLIILQGEVKGDLGKELLIYGNREWEALIELSEKRMAFLQPIMFLLIAVLIVSIYGALLLPIYSGMGDFS
ncbi:competence type IV pilus assembly protein ComGB [Vagococcus hydrophili]|uniref:Type II secretion system F family protein n=1 Tax=Vagococcus hydrophili TaxID=2714947 RepID=A0A6G8ARS9_9ENTE|nr:competence type IV pilus assembly protein ComGB [Vagococcus hydrophili]QIL47706.1 type II secretion system F family protein [Vagococcus hydrophili]